MHDRILLTLAYGLWENPLSYIHSKMIVFFVGHSGVFLNPNLCMCTLFLWKKSLFFALFLQQRLGGAILGAAKIFNPKKSPCRINPTVFCYGSAQETACFHSSSGSIQLDKGSKMGFFTPQKLRKAKEPKIYGCWFQPRIFEKICASHMGSFPQNSLGG